MRWISIALLLVGCGNVQELYDSRTPEELLVYHERFRELIGDPKAKVGSIFVDSMEEGTVVGRCTFQSKDGLPLQISINRKFWDTVGDLQREQLLFHELAHCLYGLGHEEAWEEGRPLSIMHPSLVQERTYATYRLEYHQELRRRIGNE